MERTLPYIIPNLCAWCGNSEIIDSKEVEADVNSVPTQTGDISIRTVKINLSICKKCKNNILRSKKVFIPHGLHIEFLNTKFHTEFMKLNPDFSVSFIPDQLVFPSLCAKCSNEPPIKFSTGIAKSDIQIPIGENCQKNSKNATGCILHGKLYFFDIPFHVEFARLNPDAAYDLKQAFTDGSYETDFELVIGVGADGVNRYFLKDDTDSAKKYKAIEGELIKGKDHYQVYAKNWFLSCGLTEETANILINMLFSTETDRDEFSIVRLTRRVRRISQLVCINTYEKSNSKDDSNSLSGLVKLGIENLYTRIYFRTKEYFSDDVAHEAFREIKKGLEGINKKEIIEAQESNRQLWEYWKSMYSNAQVDLASYLRESWVFLDSDVVSLITDQVFNGQLLQVFDLVNRFSLVIGLDQNSANQKALQVYADLKMLEALIPYLRIFKNDESVIDPQLEFLLKSYS